MHFKVRNDVTKQFTRKHNINKQNEWKNKKVIKTTGYLTQIVNSYFSDVVIKEHRQKLEHQQQHCQ